MCADQAIGAAVPNAQVANAHDGASDRELMTRVASAERGADVRRVAKIGRQHIERRGAGAAPLPDCAAATARAVRGTAVCCRRANATRLALSRPGGSDGSAPGGRRGAARFARDTGRRLTRDAARALTAARASVDAQAEERASESSQQGTQGGAYCRPRSRSVNRRAQHTSCLEGAARGPTEVTAQ